jgi:hypothetical protein
MSSRLPVLLGVLLLGCDAGQEPNPCGSERVTLMASVGTTPTFTWAPACGVAAINVAEARLDGPGVWHVETTDTRNTIDSEVRYGQRPGGTTVRAGPLPLVAGRAYTVLLLVAEPLSDGTTGISGIGDLTFTP